MKHEITVKRGVEPWTTRFNLTGGLSGVPDRNCVEMTLYGLPPELLAMMKEHDVKVTLETVQTREERLREARIAGLKEFWRTTSMSGSYDESKIIAVIERVDAELAKGEK